MEDIQYFEEAEYLKEIIRKINEQIKKDKRSPFPRSEGN